MTDKKIYSIRLPQKLIEDISSAAKDAKLTSSAFIINTLHRAVQETKTPHPPEDETITWLPLRAETRKELAVRARASRMTIEDYIMKISEPKPPVSLTIKYQDLDALTEQLDELIRTVNSICGIIMKTESSLAGEVDAMIHTLRQILDLYIRIYQTVDDNRNNLYKEAKEELLKNIKRYQTAERKRKSREQHGSNKD